MERSKQRKIFKVGGHTYVVSLPSHWAEEVSKKASQGGFDGQVYVSEVGDKIVVAPVEEYKQVKVALEAKDVADSVRLEARLYAAYLRGSEEVTVPRIAEDPKMVEALDNVQRKVYGLSYRGVSPSEIQLSIKTEPRPLTGILDEGHSLYEGMLQLNERILANLPLDRVELDRAEKLMTEMENDVDKMTFLAKRLLNSSLIDPQTLRDADINHEYALTYDVIAESLEELADLQNELLGDMIALELDDKSSKTINFAYLGEYLRQAARMVKDSYEGQDSSDKLVKILKTKNQESKEDRIQYREGYIDYEMRKKVVDMIRGAVGKVSARTVYELTHLESRIFAMTSVATNIAEAWMNIRPLEAGDSEISPKLRREYK